MEDLHAHELSSTLGQVPVGIAILRGDKFLVEMANPAYLELVNKKEAGFVGRTLFDVLPEVKEIVEPLLRNVLQTGTPFLATEFQVELLRNGTVEKAWFNLVYQPLREENIITGIIVVATEVSAQVKTRLELEENQNKFRSLVTQSPIGMAIFRGRDLIIELANKTMLNGLWKKSIEEVEGQKLLDIFPELKGQKYPGLLLRIFETKTALRESEALAFVGKDMQKYYLDYEYAPLIDFDGNVSGIIATVNDVTEKVVARKRIEEAEEKYRTLIESMPAALYTVDKDGYIDMYNKSALQLWGREPEEKKDKWWLAKKLFDINNNELLPEETPIARALTENKEITAELTLETNDGILKNVIVDPRPLHDAEGNVTGALNMIIDITDRKNAEKAVRESEERFRLLADSMPQFIWTAGPDGVLNYFSESVYEYAGFSYEEMLEKGWLDIVHEEDREENIRKWIHAIATGEDFSFEHRFRKYDGEYRWQLSRAIPQKNDAGNIQLWVGTSTDIHDRKLFTDNLEQQVALRTRELQESNEDLINVNRELEQFAYVASHDLQEPLRKIQTFTSVLEEMEKKNLSEKGRDYFERIKSSCMRMQQLIKDLLAYSAPNSSEQKGIVDLNALVQSIIKNIEIKSADITVEQAGELPVLTAIPFQMEQLFTNLITNAVKFTVPGKANPVRISAGKVKGKSILAEGVTPGKNYHIVTISDEGTGFDPKFKERMFKVFQRLHDKELYEGTGIGLAICKKITDNHKGYIDAESEEGKGSTFKVYFPA